MKVVCENCKTVWDGTLDDNCPGCGLVDYNKEYDGGKAKED